ncbi:MAG TPA: hypothetical protein VG733_07605 [Chthoniobacteraceae bacterium]|nr:hypothetical protein [Chthoniobacteraceae bacterium]
MKNSSFTIVLLLFYTLAAMDARGQTPSASPTPSPAAQPQVETLVMIRHGEKPAGDLGQLTFQGLNRALALPDVLIKKYGKADFVFAPGTRTDVTRDGNSYSYIRPLITIEPTAIRLGLPVNAEFAFDEIAPLQKELLSPRYANALIFVAWEHIKLDLLVKNTVRDLGGDPNAVPEWPGKDFDSIFVLKIRTEGGKRTVTFQHDQEGLDGMSTQEPVAMPAAK